MWEAAREAMPLAGAPVRGAAMTAKRNRTKEIEIGLRIALCEFYRGVLATRLKVGLARHYAGSASRLAHGPLRDAVRGDRSAFAKAAKKVRGEDARCRAAGTEELRVVYPELPRTLGVRLDERDVEAFWSMIKAALFSAAKKTEEVEVTRIGRLWIADQRGQVSVFSGVHSQGDTKRGALANLAKMIASLRKEGRRLIRQKWIRSIVDTKLREEVMRLTLARGAIDARDFSAGARKELARIDAESSTAIEAVRAGKVGPRVLRNVENCKDDIDDLVQAPVLYAQLREIHKHPERLVTSEEIRRRFGMKPAPKRRRAGRS
jgi:hypothetical protein